MSITNIINYMKLERILSGSVHIEQEALAQAWFRGGDVHMNINGLDPGVMEELVNQ